MRGFILVAILWVACTYGWVMNIVKIVGIAKQDKPVSTMFIIRCVGVPVAPVGVVLGYMD